MAVYLAIGGRRPGGREEWGYWVNFIGGMVGAAAFSIPALLALPFFLLAYARRPNALFPAGTPPSHNLFLAAIFSLLGAFGVLLMIVLGRASLRTSRRQRQREAARREPRPRTAR